eukprot:TRINITY_DN320_c0_g1_i1.p1 TRINITY_DN320_c0_g1~~TRINITY_DN320_c0_g1_i1.p1  ORF type:complete len:381 (+),score=51.76 TRINITY_DN320_c0_g1_i1:135-1277(+)
MEPTFDHIALIPGPTSVPKHILSAFAIDLGSSDLEPTFFEEYHNAQKKLATLLHTPSSSNSAISAENEIIIQSGEGMLALWSALKSCVGKGDRVLAIANGLFGAGIAEMAEQIGAEVKTISFEWDTVPHTTEDFEKIRTAAKEFQPVLITAVHCETPSGTLTPLEEIGKISKEVGALLYVDFVASGLGTQVEVSKWSIDLGLLGSQKVLSIPPCLSIVTVSEQAWARIEQVKYSGYDALLPWKDAVKKLYLPYTFFWQGLRALQLSLDDFLREGEQAFLQRHEQSAVYVRDRITKMGLTLYCKDIAHASPTVTAVYVPEGWTWQELDKCLRSYAVTVGGNYGPLKEKVFRIGHMGSQANLSLLTTGMDLLEKVLQEHKQV